MLLSDLILNISKRAFSLQREDGSFPGGHNGPYHDSETPARNSGHWLITFSKCYELTGETEYLDRVSRIAEYLSSKSVRPHGYSFYHRNKKGKDKCNGLVGQAWTIEALVEASNRLDDDIYSSLAAEVFLKHPFDHEYGLWNRLEIDGRVLTMDETFNHQLWFAARGSLIGKSGDPEISLRVKRFMDCLSQNLTVLESGLIHHPIEKLKSSAFSKDLKCQKNLDREFLQTIQKIRFISFFKYMPFIGESKEKRIQKLLNKSIGYHSFNMYAFGLLNSNFTFHEFWDSEPFRKSVDYMLKNEYINLLDKNKYGYPYNPPGFEVPYSLYVLKDMKRSEFTDIIGFWAKEQFSRCYNKEKCIMDMNTEDPLTHTARIYELTRLPVDLLEAIDIEI